MVNQAVKKKWDNYYETYIKKNRNQTQVNNTRKTYTTNMFGLNNDTYR